jgi:hypothetical protein
MIVKVKSYYIYMLYFLCKSPIKSLNSISTCARAYGLGSQCRPNECIFGSGKLRGVGILGKGVFEPGEGNGEVSLRATWERGGRILSQQGGFQVSEEGQKGEQKGISKGKKKKGIMPCT